MDDTIGNMTADELRALIANTIEEKLLELFGDPDCELTLRDEVRERLRRQLREVEQGERGESMDEVVEHLRLS